ncbi:hypothetical protein ACFQ9X_10920 [Catenulispora yoronensis]
MAADAPSPSVPPPGGAVRQLWSLRPDVLVETADRTLTLVSRWGETVIRAPGPLLRDSLTRMQLGPIWLDNVLDVERRPQAQVLAERAAMMLALGRLEHLVVRSLAAEGGGRILLSVEPVARAARFRPQPVEDGLPVRLSRFTTLRTVGGLLTAESPLALHRVLMHQPEAAMLVAALAGARTPQALETLVGGPPELVRTALSYLLAAGIAVRGGPACRTRCSRRTRTPRCACGRRTTWPSTPAPRSAATTATSARPIRWARAPIRSRRSNRGPAPAGSRCTGRS